MQKKSRTDRILKYVAAFAVVVIVFMIGLNVGNGRISFFGNGAIPANSSLPNKLDYSSVNSVYQQLRQHYDGKLTVKQLLNGMKHGLAESTGDPHTEYFTPKEVKQFDQQLNNEITGIGAQIGKDNDGNLQVVSPIKGFPAAKAGVQAGDLIASVNGQSTSGWSITKAVTQIRGKQGTKVKLGLVRDNKLVNITITRDKIDIPSVSWKVIDGHIGYISIITFGNDTSELAQKAAKSLKQRGVDSIILDVRGNPGGLLSAAVDVSSLWLKNNDLVVQEKRGPEVVSSRYSTGNDLLRGLPTVVLINGGSASASEITAGALHDHKVATLVGTKSYGKGTVQEIEELSGGAQLKVTIAKWYRPNGKNIDKKGIKPDKKVKLSAKDIAHGRDPQLDAAKRILNKK